MARHPVASAIVATIDKFSLPRAQCLELIDARTFDLYDDPMPDTAQLEIYCNSTAGALFRLAATLLAGRELLGIAEPLTHAGRAYAITGLLRAFALHASRGQIYMPLDVLTRHGVAREDIVSGKGAPGLAAALAEIRALARGHYAEASRRMTSLPREALPALLPLELVPALSRSHGAGGLRSVQDADRAAAMAAAMAALARGAATLAPLTGPKTSCRGVGARLVREPGFEIGLGAPRDRLFLGSRAGGPAQFAAGRFTRLFFQRRE